MLRTLSLALLAGLVTTTSLHGRQGREPCAELNDDIRGYVPAEIALACLRSIPLQPEQRLRRQLAGLRSIVQFQSDLEYLNSGDDFPARLYPNVDVLGGLDTLEDRITDGFYGNEYDFQLDISRLFASAYDGHFAYVADIVDVFNFQRRADGMAYRLISVSEDGTTLPEVYAASDGAALASGAGYEPSSISEINGQSADDFLNMEASLTGVFQDPDANFNRLFQRTYAQGTAGGAFAIPGTPFFGSADDTELTFRNGSTQTLQMVAGTTLNLRGVSNADDFFQRCCSGNPVIEEFSTVLEQIELISEMKLEESSKKRLKALVGPKIAHDVSKSTLFSTSIAGSHVIRQADIVESDPMSDPVISTEDGSLIGYFPESESDLAILALTTFAVGLPTSNSTMAGFDQQAVEDFQIALESFLDEASDAGRSRLIIDLRGNPGGLGFLPHQVFRHLFPTTELPYQGSNLRAHDLLDFAGQTITDFFSTDVSATFEELRPTVGVFAFDAAQQLDESNSTFDSWSDFFGPVQVPSVDGDFTATAGTNYSDPEQTQPIDLATPLRSRQQVFEAENIVLLQDGACASACALFTEFMKTSAPDGPVRQVVTGGRSQTGPMQGVGGVKGGQLAPMLQLGIILLSGITITPQTLTDFRDGFGRDAIPEFVEALNRSSTVSAAVNYRNSIRENDESVTPLQYIYEAAECQIFYTPRMMASPDAVWQRVYEVAFGGQQDTCVEGSTGHPSAGGGTDFGINVPDDAASSVGLTLSNVSDVRSGGGSGNSGGQGSGEESEEGDNEESGAVIAKTSAAGILVALVACLLA